MYSVCLIITCVAHWSTSSVWVANDIIETRFSSRQQSLQSKNNRQRNSRLQRVWYITCDTVQLCVRKFTINVVSIQVMIWFLNFFSVFFQIKGRSHRESSHPETTMFIPMQNRFLVECYTFLAFSKSKRIQIFLFIKPLRCRTKCTIHGIYFVNTGYRRK